MFVATDVNNIYLAMGNKLAPPSSALGACIVAVSFFQWVSVFCILVILNKYKEDESLNRKKNDDFQKVETSPDPKRL